MRQISKASLIRFFLSGTEHLSCPVAVGAIRGKGILNKDMVQKLQATGH